MAKQPKTLIEKYEAIQKIGNSVPVPWFAARLIHPRGELAVSADQICIGSDDADFGSLEECRQALSWYVEQLGGEVTWQK